MEKGLTGDFIDSFLILYGVPNFMGVFSSDTIPVGKCKNRSCYSMIVNMSKQNEQGTHWIAIIVHKNMAIYFDSLSLPNARLYKRLIENIFPKLNIYSVLKNEIPIQSLQSTFCGFYCIYAIIYFSSLTLCYHELNPPCKNVNFDDLRALLHKKSNQRKSYDMLIPLLANNPTQNDEYVISNLSLFIRDRE